MIRDEALKDLTLKLKTTGGKILVVQTAFLGDVVLITPLLRAIRNNFPDVSIKTLTQPQYASIVNGWVDDTLTINKKTANRETWNNLVRQIKDENFDLVLSPHRSLRTGYLLKRAEIPLRIGFNRGGGRLFHTHKVNYQFGLYEGLRNISLLRLIINDLIDSGIPEIKFSDEEVGILNNFLKDNNLELQPYFVIAPGSIWTTKTWLADYYKELITIISKEYNLTVVAIGGEQDRHLCSKIIINNDLNFAGKLDAKFSALLILKARFLISGDTAPAHLATAVNTKQLIIYGSTTPRFGFFPYTQNACALGIDIWCRPCTDHGRIKCPLGNMRCLKEITPQKVVQIIKDWI